MARYFEEYQEGEVFRSPGRTITETDVVNFSALSGDWNELHANEEFARRQYFGRRIVHGALIFSVSMGTLAFIRSGTMARTIGISPWKNSFIFRRREGGNRISNFELNLATS